MSSKENYFRLLCLTFESAVFVLRKLIEQHLKHKQLSLEDFIVKNQHGIYHLYKRNCYARQCSLNMSETCLKTEQIEKLFDTEPNAGANSVQGHTNQCSKKMCFCFASRTLTLEQLDFTLLRILLINFCEEEFWIYTLRSYDNSFDRFLQDNVHDMFHLSHEKIGCCQCRTGYDDPKEIIMSEEQLHKLYNTSQNFNEKHAHHSCNLGPKLGFTCVQIKQIDCKLFQSLTNYFCEVRKSIDNINKVRNTKIAHPENLEITDEDFAKYWNILEEDIITIAEAANCVSETQESIKRNREGLVDPSIISKIQLITQNQNGQSQDNNNKCIEAFESLSQWFARKNSQKESELLQELNKKSIYEEGTTSHTSEVDYKDCQAIDFQNNNELKTLQCSHSQKRADKKTEVDLSDFLLETDETNTNVEEYKLQKAELTLTFEKRRIIEKKITLTDSNGAESTVNNHNIEPINALPSDATSTGFLDSDYVNSTDSGEDSDEKEDEHVCGTCDAKFNRLYIFIEHKKVCVVTEKKKKKKKTNSKQVDKKQVTVAFERTDDDTVWKQTLNQSTKLRTDEINTRNISTDFGESGSLVLWTRMSSSVMKKKEDIVENIDEFVNKFLEKCPVNTDEKTTLTVKVNVLQQIEDDEGDTFKCGSCKEVFTSVDKFCSHKKECNRRRRQKRKIKKSSFEETTSLGFTESTGDSKNVDKTFVSDDLSQADSEDTRKASLQHKSEASTFLKVEEKQIFPETLDKPNQRRDRSRYIETDKLDAGSPEHLFQKDVLERESAEQKHKVLKELALPLYPDECKTFASQLSNTDPAESGKGVLREVRKKQKRKKKQRQKQKSEFTDEYTDSSEVSTSGIESDYMTGTSEESTTARGFKSYNRKISMDSTLGSRNKLAYATYLDETSSENEELHLSDDSYNESVLHSPTELDVSQSSSTSNLTENEDNENFFEKSKRTKIAKLEDDDFIKCGLDISPGSLQSLLVKFKRKTKKVYYHEFINDVEELQKLCITNPLKYKKGRLEIEASHCAKCTIDSSGVESVIEISGRSKCGKAYTDDEVVVEILGREAIPKKSVRMKKRGFECKIFGKVIGVLKQNRCHEMRHPVFVCEIDEYEMDKAKPLCKTVPKIHLLRHESESKYYSVDIYQYNKERKSLDFEENMTINRHSIKTYLFYVVTLSWELQYPVGAIFKVHRSTKNYISSMKILDLQYKVPSLYNHSTIECAEEIATLYETCQPITKEAKRFDLTDLKVFTIDPEKSVVFDDAISIRYLPDNGYEVGVHITDVASVVLPGTPLDIEARKRGTTHFPGQFLCPHQMLPEPISEDICCLVPGKDRPTLTVWLYFDENKNICFEKTKYCKSAVRSQEKLTYKEVESIIDNSNNEHHLKREIMTLYSISRNIRKTRLGNSFHSMRFELDLPGEGDSNSIEAYSLIEEFMIVANYLVAILITKTFPDVVPLRCQDPPSINKVHEWRESYPTINELIMELQGTYPLKEHRLSYVNTEGKLRPNDILGFQHRVWSKIHYYMSSNDFEMAKRLVCTDEIHPQQGLALGDWRQFQERAIYRSSGMVSKPEEGRHFSLGLTPYAHFTAPIRRYIDIIVQRLFHSAIDGQSSPYTKEEIQKICEHANTVSKNADLYRTRCKELIVAGIFASKPFMTHGFVADFSETEIVLNIPGINFVHNQNRILKVSFLQISASPETKQDADYIRMTKLKDRLILKWRKRIYSTTEKQPRPKNAKRGYQRSDEEYQKLDPHQKAEFHQTTKWVKYLKLLTSGATRAQLSTELSSTVLSRENLQRKYLPSTFSSELDINSEIDRTEANKNEERVIMKEQFCKFTFSFSHGQVVAVQFSADMKNGMLTPTIDFFDMTHGIKFCLKHMRDPVSVLERYSTIKAKEKYVDSKEYKEIWIPILLMEASFSVVRQSGVLVNDVYIKFEQRSGHFTLKTGFCFERNIQLSCISHKFLEKTSQRTEAKIFTTHVSDYLCIRCPMSYETNDTFLGHGLHCEKYFWVGHAKISRIQELAKDTPEEKIRVYFKLVNEETIPEKLRFSEKGVKCSVEILERLESNKRTEVTIDFLNRANSLARAIALNKPTKDLDETFQTRITKCDIHIGLPPNNERQNKAIRTSLQSSFCLIHGPPGTGKTNTGIKLIHLFHEINNVKEGEEEEDEGHRTILFCGPSNKSVDLVAKRLRRFSKRNGPNIVRFYGSTVEQQDFEIPGGIIVDQPGMDYKPDPELQDVSIHHLIRTSGEHAAEILGFENDFKRKYSNANLTRVKQYRKLLKCATLEELAKYDVIFCTTSMATSPRLLEAIRGKVSQLIIDECGMCTEPECISSIIATRPKQVVLIGDHMQLRPIVMCKQAAELGLDKSLFERYCKTAKYVQLNMQYRMHASICEFPSKQFYEGELQTADSPTYVERLTLSIWQNDKGSIRAEKHIFIHVDGYEEYSQVSTESENERSVSNAQEVDQVLKIFNYLYHVDKIFDRGTMSATLNIMSQYNAQCNALKEAIQKEPAEKQRHADIHTVVSSQGGEWDYVIFSLVRSLPDYRIEPHPTKGWCAENLGFITDYNQINVALTRARKGLFIIGNINLLRCDETWRALLEFYDGKGCIVNGDNFPTRQRQRRKVSSR